MEGGRKRRRTHGGGGLYLSVREAAALLGVSTRTWWRWAANGTAPPAVRVGGVTLWRRSQLERWMDQLPTNRRRRRAALDVAAGSQKDSTS